MSNSSFGDSNTARGRMQLAQAAATEISLLSDTAKRDLLYSVAEAITAAAAEIVAANESDLSRGVADGMTLGLQDRLRLTSERVAALSEAVREIAELPDPVGRILDERTLDNGVELTKISVPFGVVGAIYEARPNVTVDIAALALRSGNAVVLRGGSAALASNAALISAMRSALAASGVNPDAIQTVDDFGRDGAKELMQARGLIDVLVPRGSAQLIDTVVTQSQVPVIETGAGVVHIFVDASADLEQARAVVVNAKVQRPSVCNAVETILVHEDIANEDLSQLVSDLQAAGVTVHGDETVQSVADAVVAASEADWATEYLSLDVAIRVVSDLDEALAHIRRYSTKHTESILSQDQANIDRFIAEVDAAVVMSNASTRFTDGGVFGFGAEVGISTQKLHARGPMGLAELTSTKWIARGNGQIRS